MLIDVKRDCVNYAKQLGDYQSIDIDTLATKYCEALDNNDMPNKNRYLSALILRFWYVIDKLYKRDYQLKLEYEDFFGWLVEAINYAAKYRGWLKPNAKGKTPNAQSCINQCIATIRSQHYYAMNLDKSKVNQSTISLDRVLSSDDSNTTTVGDLLEDSDYENARNWEQSAEVVKSYIQTIINDGRPIDAIILDLVAFNEVEKQTKKITKEIDENGNKLIKREVESEFWAHKLVKMLGNLPEGYSKYFADTYNIGSETLNAALEKVKASNNQKLYRYMRKCFDSCRGNLKQAFLR